MDLKGSETSSEGIHGCFSEMGTLNYLFFLNGRNTRFLKNNHVNCLMGEVFISYEC